MDFPKKEYRGLLHPMGLGLLDMPLKPPTAEQDAPPATDAIVLYERLLADALVAVDSEAIH
jgi:hypothetical protein